jgi:hypothetical protein
MSVSRLHLWPEEFDVQIDKEKLSHKGENLIYSIFGSTQYLIRVINFMKYKMEIMNVYCIDESFDFEKFLNANLHQRVLLLVRDITLLSPKSLNYIFRIADKTFEKTNILVSILWNNDTVPVSLYCNERDELNRDTSNHLDLWRTVLSKKLQNSSSYINGYALAGRVTRATLQSCYTSNVNLISVRDFEYLTPYVQFDLNSICTRHNSFPPYLSKLVLTDLYLVFYFFFGVVSLTFMYIFLRSSTSSRSSSPVVSSPFKSLSPLDEQKQQQKDVLSSPNYFQHLLNKKSSPISKIEIPGYRTRSKTKGNGDVCLQK